MHLFIITRGIKKSVDSLIDELQKIMLPMYMKIEPAVSGAAIVSGAETSGALSEPQTTINFVQVAVRPVQAWEIVFPKEHEDLMCATLFEKSRGQTNQKWLKPYFWLLRKVLKLKPINWNFREKPLINLAGKEFVEIIGIGKKEDAYLKDDKNEFERL